MSQYDIVFVGHVTTGQIEPFEGTPSFGHGGASLFGALAASCLGGKFAVVTRIAEADAGLIEPLRASGIDVYALPSRETNRMRVVYPSANVDERRIFLIRSAGLFRIEDMPLLDSRFFHLAGLSNQEFDVEFMRKLKGRGCHLSVDMQSFVWHVDDQTGAIHFEDVPEKQEILRMVDFVKLDVAEAAVLTGTGNPGEAAAMLEGWGSRETVITRSDGVLARSRGKDYFERFSHRGVDGRTGRGDTLFGAYLAHRMEHPVDESLRFAAALASIKIETPGPFTGTLEDVLARMNS